MLTLPKINNPEGNLVSVPILYVMEEKPNSRDVSETQKQQTQKINANHKPKSHKKVENRQHGERLTELHPL